jgi:hypothetical protein
VLLIYGAESGILTPSPTERNKQMELDYANYYEKRCKIATIEQGIDVLIDALDKEGIVATAEQTGGFTMCAYIQINSKTYIYANLYGAGIYDEEDYIEELIQFDDEQKPETIAQAIANYAKKEWNK